MLYYAEAWNKFAGPIAATLRLDNTAPFEEKLQQWQAVGNSPIWPIQDLNLDLPYQSRASYHSAILPIFVVDNAHNA